MKNVINLDKMMGEKLKNRRKQLKLTQLDVASELNIAYQTLQKYELGQTRLPATLLYQLSKLYGVTIDYFYHVIEQQEHKHRLPSPGEKICLEAEKRTLSILLIEDNQSDQELTCWAINSVDPQIQVTIEDNVDNACQYLQAQTTKRQWPDIVLLDLKLQGESSIDLLNKIKTTPKTRMIPVIVLTHSIDSQEMLACYEHHCSGYLCKAYDIHVFKKHIETIVTYWSQMITPRRF